MDTIQELRERKARLIDEITLIDQYLKLHEKLFPADVSENKSGSSHREASSASDNEKPAGNDPRLVADKVEEVLRAHGRPMPRGELVRQIEAGGLPIHSIDKRKYLGTILWRHRDRFVNIPDEGYWVSGLPVEAEPTELPLNS